MLCKQCGQELYPEAKFCGVCGTAVELPEANDAPVAEPVEEKVVEAAEEPVVVPTEETVVEVAAEPAALLVAEPVLETVAEPSIHPKQQPKRQSLQEPVQQEVQEPAQQTEEQSEVPITEVAPVKKNTAKRVGRNLLSVFCCLLVIVFALATLGLVSVRESVEQVALIKYIDEIDIKELYRSGALDGIVSEEITAKEIQAVYEKGSFKDFLFEKIVGLVRGGGETLRTEDIIELAYENEEILIEETGYKLSASFEEEVEEFMAKDGRKLMNIFAEKGKAGVLVETARIFISVYAVIVLAALLLACLIWMCIIRKNASALLWCGIPLASVSVLGMATFFVTGVFKKVAAGIHAVLEGFAESYIDSLFGILFRNSLILFGVSALLIVTYVLIRVISKIIKENKAAKA